jgi:hypothetical protein
MNKIAILLLALPLTNCTVPEHDAQVRVEKAAVLEKLTQAQSLCRGRGIASSSNAYIPCVNESLSHDQLQISQISNGKLLLMPVTESALPTFLMHTRLSDSVRWGEPIALRRSPDGSLEG